MRALVCIASVAVFCGAISLGMAQEPPTRESSRAQRLFRAQAAQQQPGRLVSVEVVIADVAGETEGEMTAEQLAELERAGKVSSVSRLRLSALENQPAVVQFGERVFVVTGRTSFGGRGAQDAVAQENVGTMVTVTPRVEQDESILLDFQAEQSRLVPAAAKADGEDAPRPVELPKTATITAKTTIRVAPGKPVVAGSKATKTGEGTVQTWILVSATAEAARPKPGDEAAMLKVYQLVHAKSENIAELIRTVLPDDSVRIGVDTQRNNLVIHGSEETLDVIQRLISRLDEAPTAAGK